MVVAEVASEVGTPRGQIDDPAGKRDGGRFAADHTQCHRSVVAAEAEPGGTGGLADGCIDRAAAVGGIDGAGTVAVPEGRFGTRAVRRVAEDANLVLRGCTNGIRPARGQVVGRVDNAGGTGGQGQRTCGTERDR